GTIVVCTLLLAVGAAATLARASAGPPEQTGVFALLGGSPAIVSEFWAVHGANPRSATLHVRQFQIGAKSPLMNYDVEMQKTIHMVVIRDDFESFAHLHPAFNTTSGTFLEPFTKQPNHRYYVYADTTPHGLGQQVFRFTMDSDGPAVAVKPSLAPSPPTATAGPYTVTLAKTTLAANEPEEVDLTVDKGSGPAHDLGSYLGAPAHCVLINASTLAYVHVHPTVRNDTTQKGAIHMNMSGVGPLMKLHVPALPAGVYKVWIQFRGGSYTVYTVPFTMAAR
ncbi:MAG: hypothetical protein ABI231_04885, partial [Candidatus Tumulicola sp.]